MKKSWEPMQVKDAGRVRDVVQLGGGKLSTVGGDPGEPRKPSGIEGR
ncbi:MAG: hypothetical protein WD273_01910 [Trueperaceae bacterium]